MKVGDLVRQMSWDGEKRGFGVITKVVPFGFYVLFSDGEYRVHVDDAELISESR